MYYYLLLLLFSITNGGVFSTSLGQCTMQIYDGKINDIPELIEIIFDQSGYKNHIMNESENYQERNDNIRELINTAGYFSKENTNDSLSAFLESVSLVGDTDNLLL